MLAIDDRKMVPPDGYQNDSNIYKLSDSFLAHYISIYK